MSAGKGDTPRPLSVSRDEYERRWERAFGVSEADWELHVTGTAGEQEGV